MKMFVVPRFGFLFLLVSLSCSVLALPGNGPAKDPLKYILGQENLGPFRNGISEAVAQAPGPSDYGSNNTLVLAAKRTNRPDILHGFKHYRGGWNITDRHYWASVGFTGAAGFILAFLWFFLFGFALVAHHCCKWRINIKDKGSSRTQRICLIMLILFTCAAAIGCILLCVGQDDFHGEAMNTLEYVVNQSDYTVQTLKNVTEYLSLAKTINIAQLVLPSNVMDDIDKLNVDLNAAADTLTEKTSENAGKIVKVFNVVRSALIAVAAVMLILALLGFLLSILGHQHAIHIFVVSGWLLVAVTFILCGVFILLNNAISDTCLAMEEWVENPHAASALSSILPCVDQRTTNNTLVQSKEVINDIVNVVNTYIYTFANANPSQTEYNYYNQSGPSMPPLCYPFDSHYQDRQCETREVSMANASVVWQNYTCMVSSSGLCTTVGRVTPDKLKQICMQQLEHGFLTSENVVDIFQLALLCNAPQLSLICHRMILKNFQEIFNTEGWRVMKKSHPALEKELLQSVTDEEDIQKERIRKSNERKIYLQLYEAMEALVHICRDGCQTIGPYDKDFRDNQAPCNYSACKGLEMIVHHFSSCKLRVPGGCIHCKRMWQLLELHSRFCVDSEVGRVPLCRNFKERIKKQSKKDEIKWRILVKSILKTKSIGGSPFFSSAFSMYAW